MSATTPSLTESAVNLRQTGRLVSARWCPSPNFGIRPAGSDVSLLVVHNISLPPGQYGGPAIEDFFCNNLNPSDHPYFESIASMQVSSHVLIRRDGQCVQFVNLLDRAWHAGRSVFAGRAECNDYAIGIELEGTDHEPYTRAQYEALADLTVLIMAAWPAITRERIAGHSDIAPGRKTDPGPAFDWPFYHQCVASRASSRSHEREEGDG